MALTAKQQRFCDEYLIDLNGTKAAIRAGYSQKTAGQIAEENLKKPEIVEYLNEKRQVLQEKLDISQEWVLRRLKEISDRCMQAEPVMMFNGDEWVESGEYKFDSTGANKSTELIGKHLGMFVQKIDMTTKGESLNEKRPSIKLPDGTMLDI